MRMRDIWRCVTGTTNSAQSCEESWLCGILLHFLFLSRTPSSPLDYFSYDSCFANIGSWYTLSLLFDFVGSTVSSFIMLHSKTGMIRNTSGCAFPLHGWS